MILGLVLPSTVFSMANQILSSKKVGDLPPILPTDYVLHTRCRLKLNKFYLYFYFITEFCCSEKGELLTMRLRILCEDRCEDIAVNLAAACVRSLRRSDQLRSVCEAQHVQYMIDVYIVLLYKLKRTQDIFAQVLSNFEYPLLYFILL